jgi:hypothetical protein
MKLDIFNHFLPREIFERWREEAPEIDALPVSAAERAAIYEGNARKLLKLV